MSVGVIGVKVISQDGSCLATFWDGGNTLCRSANNDTANSMAPAAEIKCPVMLLVLDTFVGQDSLGNTLLIAKDSTLSFSKVDVP